MPIKFRCPNCTQFLGISRGSAGAIVDCPSCGRTIRVPHTDGSVQPLPPPRLDLQDQELQQALDQLADLAPAETGKTPFLVAPPPAILNPAQPSPSPAPVPVVVDSPKPHQNSHLERITDAPPEDVLAELSAVQPHNTVPPAGRPASQTRRDMLVALGTMAVTAPLAWLLGRSSTKPDAIPTLQDAQPLPQAPVAANPPAEVAPIEPGTAIRGRITYIAPDGESRADAGARILVLPEERLGTARLSVAGFRSMAAEADAMLARESLRLLGGAFTLADAQGNYAASLTSSGSYYLLLISRYQASDSRQAGFDELNRVLGEYFDKPAQLIGQMRYDFGRFRYQGQTPAIRDHVFQRI